MTVQPLKNEPAVVPVVNNHATSNRLNLDLRSTQQVTGKERKVEHQEKLSGAAVAPAKDSALRLAAVSEESASRSVQALVMKSATAVDIQLEAMKERLTHIAKSYPPFAMGDEKRVEYLMSIDSIRRQIEKMTYPPDQSASKVETQEMWTYMFKGVNIPSLPAYGPDEASDSQVQSALASVTAIQARLADRVSAVGQQSQQQVKISSPTAEYLSQTAGQGLSNAGVSLTNNLSGVLKSL